MRLIKKVHWNLFRLKLVLPVLFGTFLLLSSHGQTSDTTLLYPVKSIQSDPYTQDDASGIDLKNPKNFKQVTEYDPETGNYIIRNMVGDVEVGSPTLMSYEEYKKYDMNRSLNDFWRNKQLEEAGRKQGGPLDININLGKASAIFGEGGIKLKPQGYAELQFGVKTNNIDNPALSEDLRKTTIFDFDEKIVLSVAGSVGDRIKMNMDYNTEATFDFDNTINLNYEGKEDDIVKKVEAGNVSLPLGGSLIRGSQSLFGVKTELQFGKLSVATVFSQQESETETMTLKGGATSSDFEIRADEYDANRNFFLTHFFEKNYDNWMKNIPVIMSGLVINRIEVWVTNKRGDYNDSRNIVAFMDLAEPQAADIYNDRWTPSTEGVNPAYIAPANKFNTLYSQLNSTYTGFRNISEISNEFNGVMQGGVDYEKIENARLLSSNEYTLNKNLGYISLNTALNSDEVLAVAFEYQYRGQVYQVGEFSTDSIRSPQALAVKLLKGTNLSPQLKTWDLMMKNIYSLGARQVDREDFRFEVMYRSDSLGTNINYLPEPGLRDERLLNLMKLDRLNSQNEQGSDGFFDWVPGLTVIPDRGKIIFPVTKPFSSKYLSTFMSPTLAEKYAYDSLYTQTITIATQNAEKNKFILEGSYKAASGSEIKLNAFNIPRGSVVVTAGGRTLTENVDYTVDYASGYLKILNQAILDSGTPIQVSMENSATFSLQKKTMIGTHLDYRFNDDFTLGGTIMHLYERPLTQKVSIGEDPISNTIWGLNGAYKAEMPFLTKLIDKLPLIETKAPSSIAVNGEFAQLIPGHAKVIGGGGSVYLDDFEATKIGIDIKHYFSWKLSSTPTEIINATSPITDLDYGKHRARIAWYTIDRLFQYDNSNLMPSHIKNDPEMRSNNYSRAVSENNLFPNKDNAYGESTLIPILNVAYYPTEKGPYNFSLDLNPQTGKMNNPDQNWGGVMRRMETTDFEQANIEYIEFWVMDPFIEGDSPNKNKTGGKLVFNLGEISEDVLKDGRKSFEYGLPATSDINGLVDTTSWGRVPVKQSLTQAFANTENSRIYQDVGLDGLDDTDESTFFSGYLDSLTQILTRGSSTYVDSLFNDPAQDDYHYYRGSDYDAAKTSILNRYKLYNNMQGNSPTDAQSNEAYSTTGSNLPDAEDINQDNTLSENDNYYRYVVDLYPDQMKIGGQKYITDVKTEHVKLANGNEDSVKWYQFRIPVSDYDNVVGSISGFKSIRFMRMFLEDFEEPVILRFATLELVRGEWRKYTVPLDEIGENNYKDGGVIDIGSVNIEENSDRTPVNYVLPPGVDRVIDPGQPQLRQLNEQSMTLKVLNLAPQDARAVYKTLQMDMRQYKRLQMWVHAEELVNAPGVNTNLEDDDLSIFIRLGSDFKNNYYEYEIPLKLTPPRVYNNDNTAHREMVWPDANKFDIPFDLLTNFKLKRNRESRASGSDVKISQRKGEPVPDDPTHWVYIKGNPSLSDVRTIMIGVRNKRRQTTEYRSGEVWVNELRLSEFDEQGGWAGIGSMSLKLADLGTVNMSGSISTAGFGGLEQNLMERQIDDLSSYDVSTNLQLGKFFPKKAQISLPVNYSYSKDVVSPKYNPLDEDVKLQDAINSAVTQTEKDSIKSMSLDVTTRKSISLPNVRIGYGGEKKQFFDPNNVTMNFAYNETERTSPTIQRDLSKNFRGGLQYSYATSAKPVEPFKKVKFLESDILALIRDFNFYYLPTTFSFRTDMNRDYNEMLYRDISNTGVELPLSVGKDWYWNRQFDIKYKLANSLQLSLTSQSNALIGEPDYLNNDSVTVSLNKRTQRAYYAAWQDSVMQSIREWGRSVMYHQVFSASYTVPFSKIPLLDWISADGTYNATYDWQRGANSLNPKFSNLFLGHTIENSRNININTTLSFTGLYSKWKFLDDANKKYGRAGSNRSSGAKKMVTVRYENKFDFPEGQKVVINHKLGSKTPNVRIYDADNKQVMGKRNIVDENTIEFTANQTVDGARVVITARVQEKSNPVIEVLQRTARVLMGVKNVSANYTRNNSLIIPGFDGEPNIIGQDNIGGLPAPGYAFAFGSQSLDIIDQANQNGWLINNALMTDPYISQQMEQFRGQASIEPINGLRITLNTTWAQNQVTGANYYYDTENGNRFIPEANKTMTGNFSMSWISLRTAFEKVHEDESYTYAPYTEFVKHNRSIIAGRTGNKDLNSQEVLIPAFLAGYSGIDAHKIRLYENGMPDIFSQLPNWNIRYDGLSKIPLLQKYFRNVTLNHSYTATYNIAGFNTNLSSGQLEIPTVNITEALNPLLNVDMAFKNSLTGSLEMSKMRNIMLNISNNQVVETVSNDFSVGLGYRWDNFDLVINSGGRSKNVSNDLNLRADFTLRDMKTIIRKIEENYNQPSTGQNALNIKLTADYTLSRSVTIRLFYDRQAINPLVSTSFSTATSNFGVSFKFQLIQ
ncbi:cell surface protein SprA [Saccharicrinis sp. FJH2]|uniref:T9SS outer membrane translocon Sov/SprA n=1 Tax=Saccharicrinis sp. FJH65 TaxID=3344659 RepID=UPI0035F36274